LIDLLGRIAITEFDATPPPNHGHPLQSEGPPIPSEFGLGAPRKCLLHREETSNTINQPLVDTRDLDQEARRALLDGPVVQITFYAPNLEASFSTIYNIPKRLLMATSTTAQAAFRQDPESLTLSFSRADASPRAFRWILAWLINNCRQEMPFAFRYRTDWYSNVYVYQAMNALGMPGPIATIRRWLLERIAADMLSYDEMTTLLIAITPGDTVFKHLAHTYAYQRYNRYLPDPEQFDRYLRTWPAFAKAMAEIDERKADGRVHRMCEFWDQDPRKWGQKKGITNGLHKKQDVGTRGSKSTEKMEGKAPQQPAIAPEKERKVMTLRIVMT
jgi:hypothetical protein